MLIKWSCWFFLTPEKVWFFSFHKTCPTVSESQGLRPLLPLLCILLMLDMLVLGGHGVNVFQVTPARLVKALQQTDYSISICTFNSLQLFLGNYICITDTARKYSGRQIMTAMPYVFSSQEFRSLFSRTKFTWALDKQHTAHPYLQWESATW